MKEPNRPRPDFHEGEAVIVRDHTWESGSYRAEVLEVFWLDYQEEYPEDPDNDYSFWAIKVRRPDGLFFNVPERLLEKTS